MAAHFKLNDEDNGFLAAPQGASLLFTGVSGTRTWIERSEDTVVRIGLQSVAVATADGGSLGVSIEIGGATAEGQDGPSPIEHRLSASQSVQVLVKGGERVEFKAYPTGENAQVLRTIVWACDLHPQTAPKSAGAAPRDAPASDVRRLS
jgi:hypothetical protein